jgi:hypothetical protein
MRPRRIAGALLSGVLVLIPALGWSQGTSCANASFVPADGRINGAVSITGGVSGSTYYFQVPTTVGNSYSFEVVDAVDALGASAGSLSLALFSDTGCTASLSATNTKITAPGVGLFNARVSWTATTGTTLISLSVPANMTLSVTWTANDTTSYSTSWSTNGTYDTYYSLKNTTGSTITGTLTLFNTGGTQVSQTVLTINAGATGATNTVALGTPRNLTGTAMFIHNGPPAAILAEADVANFTLPTPYIQPVKFQSAREIR